MRRATLLLIAVCATSLGTASIVGGIALLRSSAQTLSQSRDKLQDLADRHALLIDRRVQSLTRFVDHLVDTALDDLDFQSVRDDAAAARQYRAQLALRFRQSLRASGMASAWLHLDPALTGRTVHVSYYRRGDRIAEEPEFDVRASGHAGDDWFAAIIDRGQRNHWTRPYAWPEWGQIVTYSHAVRVPGQPTAVGVTGSELFMDDLYAELSQVRLYDSGHIVLLNANLDLLFHPQASGGPWQAAYPGVADKLVERLRDPLQQQGVASFEAAGERWWLAFRRLSNGWLVVAQARESEALAAHERLKQQIFALIAAGAVLSLLLAAWLSRGMSRHLDRLGRQLEQSYGELESSNRAIAAQAAELQRLANTDVLTGVLSRRAGLTLLGEVIERAAKQGAVLSIAYIDINDLKRVNDRYGHDEGDRMIRAVVDAVAAEVGAYSVITRLGGDEILVILEGRDAAAAEALMHAAARRLKHSHAPSPFPIEFSHGVVEWTPEVAASDAERWISLADQRMYRRKQAMKSASAQ